jgi:hypothetical protein
MISGDEENFYAIVYKQIWKLDFSHNRIAHKWSAIILWKIFAFFALSTIGSWLYVVLVGNIWARWFMHSPNLAEDKSIMEVNFRSGQRVQCTLCPKPHYQDNRWYCSKHNRIGSCLPFYDYTCRWISAPIDLYNIKFYIVSVTIYQV